MPLRLQQLESREIPSVVPLGLVPSTLKHAYGVDTVTFSGIAGNGAGQTIAVIGYFDAPGLISSSAPGFMTSDLKMFDMALGIPDPPSFAKVNQTGGIAYPPADAAASSEWSLDVEYAHAMAPAASIVLVEATTGTYPDIIAAINYASHIPGVSIVSMSLSSVEFVGELAIDKTFVVPGVTFVGSTGDKGALEPAHYPASSPYVVAVGGTTLSLVGPEYGMETGWSGSGGGISSYESKPSYQFLTPPTPSATKRTIPDVSFDADPTTGVAVLDSYIEPPGSPWLDFPTGGTSVAAPCVAGMLAIVNQGRTINGLPLLNSGAGTPSAHTVLYSLAPSPDFHDIFMGSNGPYFAGPGYDLVTGIGSPTGKLLVDLAGGPLPVYTVTTTADSGPGSLRKALSDEAMMGIGKVVFDKTVFGSAKTITLTSGPLAVTAPVSINGPGSGLLKISGASVSRIFNVDAPSISGASVSISGLDLTNGYSGPFASGGAIYNENEALSLSDVIIENSKADLNGGGIRMQAPGGSLTLSSCLIRNNTVTAVAGFDSGTGGGISIHDPAPLTITSCTISGNSAKGDGGGINFFVGGMLSLKGSTISGNTASSGNGAGINLHYAMGTVTHSTVSGNVATAGSGGGIATGLYLTVNNSTIAFNTAGAFGGGVFTPGDTTTFNSTIVAKNTCSGSPDVNGFVAEYFSLIGVTTGATITGSGNKNGLDPMLGALSLANGGPTATHALLSGSPCINAGFNPTGDVYDQRGVGYPRTLSFGPDMGATEFIPPVLTVMTPADAGPGSLREVLAEANLLVGAQTITFAMPMPMTIALPSGPITISDAVTIAGPGSGLLTIDATGKRAFLIDDSNPATSIPVTLSGVTIKGGFVTDDFGGAIRCNGEILTISNCVFTMNAAAGSGAALATGGGGAIAAFGGSLTINDSTFTSNFAPMGFGGAIFGYPDSLTVQRSTFSGNMALVAGAIYVSGTTLIDSSLISGNSATGSASSSGGGLLFENYNFPFAFTVRNSTVTGNMADNAGGGIEVVGASLGLTIQNSTITGNSAMGISIGGGGIARVGAPAAASPVSLESTIVNGNFSPSVNKDLYSLGTVIAAYCSIGTSAGVTTFSPDPTTMSLLGMPPTLLPLMDNGGPTLTMALAPFSPLVNKGSNPAAQTTDQRYTGFARVVGSAADIGAYEVQSPPKVAAVAVNSGDVQRSRVTNVVVTFSAPVFLPGIPAEAFTLTRQSDGAMVGLSASVVTGAVTTVTLTFSGAATESGSLADGRYTLTIDATKVSNFNGFLDGNGDGTGGDSYVLVGSPGESHHLFRLFGDADANGVVDGVDFGAFRTAFNFSSKVFDFDGSGIVDGTDFGQFRSRFGATI